MLDTTRFFIAVLLSLARNLKEINIIINYNGMSKTISP